MLDAVVAMMFCQLAHADSLREICNGLACSEGKLVHLGIANAPNKSTLSYANEHRPAALFEDLVLHRAEPFPRTDRTGRRARPSSVSRTNSCRWTPPPSQLCLDLFPWAKFRRAKGGVKAHVLLDHDDYLPSYVLITEAKKSDVESRRCLDSTPVPSWPWTGAITTTRCSASGPTAKVYFVTRLKDNAAYEYWWNPARSVAANILADQLIRFTGDTGGQATAPTCCGAWWFGTRSTSGRSCC